MKKIVFTFGRFSPPQVGHAMLINKVVDMAKTEGADNRIYTSASFDSEKNPIPFSEKVDFLKQLFPKASINTNKSLTNLHQILKGLVGEKYTDIVFVVGGDRVPEFQELLGKYIKKPGSKGYDKTKHYGFNSYEVKSAGERDPDAGDISGASGTKMREYVRKNDFQSFARYTPTKNISLVRKIFKTVQRNLKEDYNLLEGCNDRSIFKAIFVCGGPGSGKDFIVKNVLHGYGLVEINSDHAFEFLMKKTGLDMKMPDEQTAERNLVRGHAKNITKERERLALAGRLGLIINSVGDDYSHTEYIKKGLENLGYECKMIIVSTSNEVSRDRNIMRGYLGGRTVPEHIRLEKWQLANFNIKHFYTLFGNNLDIIDNSLNMQTADAETKKTKEKELLVLFKKYRAWTAVKPVNSICQDWLNRGHLREFYGIGLKKYETDINESFRRVKWTTRS